MALFFFVLALIATLASALLGYFTFNFKLELETCRERLRASEASLARCGQQLSTGRVQFSALVEKYNSRKQQWKVAQNKLLEKVRRLGKYEGINDAEQLVARLKSEASDVIANAKSTAETILAEAKDDAKSERSEAKEHAKTIEQNVTLALDAATLEASKIVKDAKEKAKSIAGGAYDVMEKSTLFEKTAKAMKNVIKGYGNEYIIPESSLLDDLAEDFSHATAGRSLKLARDRTKMMILNGTAAACDYAESSRRETAVSFVLDAFNGKVDSILSRTKHDNAGKLSQSIRDAHTLVNFNGKAFRDARITDQFLDARLEELKWGEISHQLAKKDREEQRYAKEKIREEARAIKEQERALKEAAKEEEKIQKALLQAREQFEHSSGEQREMYEQRLKDMEDRLSEALERKERARSMAEKTKKGYVYIISNIGSFGEDVFKIGLTRRDNPLDRVKELGDASVPFGFDVHAMILSDDAPALEHKLHQHFACHQINKVNHRKEFFNVTLTEIKAQIDSMDLTTGVKWTLTSVAKEYRESLAIENDPTQKEAWMRRQTRMAV